MGFVEEAGQTARVSENRVQMRGLVEAGKAMCEYQGAVLDTQFPAPQGTWMSTHQVLCSEGGGESGKGRMVEVCVGVVDSSRDTEGSASSPSSSPCS